MAAKKKKEPKKAAARKPKTAKKAAKRPAKKARKAAVYMVSTKRAEAALDNPQGGDERTNEATAARTRDRM